MRRTPLTLAVVYLCAGVVFLTFVWGVLVIYTNSQVNRAALERSGETLARIKSCTTPGKECFDDGQKRTGEAVGNINEITVYAAICADKPGVQTQAEIERCIRLKLAKNAAR